MLRSVSVTAILIASATPAFGQRANENAVEAADDAFGTSLGNGRIGLYNVGDARGFSPMAETSPPTHPFAPATLDDSCSPSQRTSGGSHEIGPDGDAVDVEIEAPRFFPFNSGKWRTRHG